MDRTRVSAILLLGLPIVGGMTSQTLFNLVDTAMVGQLGTDALAAVGVGGFVNFLSV
ncbi:MAG: MATE family efflux transporter, partial [Alphaproteobacteria bacterium]|nr:MATE family efflux transporter [Alphaproteobacteria bacterium]